MYRRLVALDLQDLSPKFGFVMDYFEQPRCIQYSSDIRIYLKEHDVLLALDGADAGVTVNYSEIGIKLKIWSVVLCQIALINLAVFLLCFHGGLSVVICFIANSKEIKFKNLRPIEGGVSFALNSGQFNASQLVKVLKRASFSGNIRVTPWRALYLPNCELFDVAPYQVNEQKFFDRVNF